MLTHQQVWRALDRLASQKGISVSRMARLGGLDPTTFNLSKRIKPNGDLRWPSTESIAKVLLAMQTSISAFMVLLEDTPPSEGIEVPGQELATLSARDFSEDGLPTGGHWHPVTLLHTSESVFAIRQNADPTRSEALSSAIPIGSLALVAPRRAVRAQDVVLALPRAGSGQFRGATFMEAKEGIACGARVLGPVIWVSR